MRWGVALPLLVFPIATSFGTTSCGASDPGLADEGPPDAYDAGNIVLKSLSDGCVVPTLTGQAVLALVQPEYDATLTYNPAFGGGSTSLKLFVTYTNGVIVCDRSGNPTLSLTVLAKIVTLDGTFNESIDAALTANSMSFDVSMGTLHLAALEEISAVSGTFKPSFTGSYSSHHLDFSAALQTSVGDGGVDAAPVGTTGFVTEWAIGDTSSEAQMVGGWK